MKTDKMIAVVLIGILIYAAYGLISNVIERTTTAQQSIVYTEPGKADVNLSQANLNNSQAAQINQAVRRQNEMDDGIAINVGARVVTGRGITDAEQVGTGLFSLYSAAMMVLGVVLVGFGGYIVYRLSKSSSVEV